MIRRGEESIESENLQFLDKELLRHIFRIVTVGFKARKGSDPDWKKKLQALVDNIMDYFSSRQDLLVDLDENILQEFLRLTPHENKQLRLALMKNIFAKNKDCYLCRLAEIIDFVSSPEDGTFVSNYLLRRLYNNNHDAMTELLYNPFRRSYFETYQNFVNHFGYPVTLEMLLESMNRYNYQFIEFILGHVDNDWANESERESILKTLLRIEDPTMGEMILQRFPEIENLPSFNELLEEAVRGGRSWSVAFLLRNRRDISREQLAILMPLALQSYNLPLIRRLSSYDSAHYPYPEILGLESSQQNDDEFFHRLLGFAMHSPLHEIYDLATGRIQNVLPELLQLLSLMVRFPNPELRSEVPHIGTMSIEEYIRESREYARANRQLIEETLSSENNHQISRVQLLDRIVRDRFQRLPTELHLQTRLEYTTNYDGAQLVQTLLIHRITGISNRYGFALRHLLNRAYDGNRHEFNLPPEVSLEGDTRIVFTHPVRSGRIFSSQRRLPITALNFASLLWNHNQYSSDEQRNIDEMYSFWDNLHREIMDFPLDPNDPASRISFFQKVARAYWLNATMCEMRRGTPHNAMMWLNFVYAHHHLPPPIPRLEHFYLDNTMLMMPVEWAIENWEEFFEPSSYYYDEFFARRHNSLDTKLSLSTGSDLEMSPRVSLGGMLAHRLPHFHPSIMAQATSLVFMTFFIYYLFLMGMGEAGDKS